MKPGFVLTLAAASFVVNPAAAEIYFIAKNAENKYVQVPKESATHFSRNENFTGLTGISSFNNESAGIIIEELNDTSAALSAATQSASDANTAASAAQTMAENAVGRAKAAQDTVKSFDNRLEAVEALGAAETVEQIQSNATQLNSMGETVANAASTATAASTAANDAMDIATTVRDSVGEVTTLANTNAEKVENVRSLAASADSMAKTSRDMANNASVAAQNANQAAIEAEDAATKAQQTADNASDKADEAITQTLNLDQRMRAFEDGFGVADVSQIHSNTKRIDALEDNINELEQGIAMAIAMANAPVIYGGERGFSLSGGVGSYKGKTAFSLKSAWTRPDRFGITASMASDLDGQFAFGGGVGFAF